MIKQSPWAAYLGPGKTTFIRWRIFQKIIKNRQGTELFSTYLLSSYEDAFEEFIKKYKEALQKLSYKQKLRY